MKVAYDEKVYTHIENIFTQVIFTWKQIPDPTQNYNNQFSSWCLIMWHSRVNILRLRQNGCHFPDDIFKCIFLKENVQSLIKISLKLALMGPMNNIPALVQIMAWRRVGNKPLSEPMMVSLLKHICITQPQWVNVACPPVHSQTCFIKNIQNVMIQHYQYQFHRDHFAYVPSQWETTIQSNVISIGCGHMENDPWLHIYSSRPSLNVVVGIQQTWCWYHMQSLTLIWPRIFQIMFFIRFQFLYMPMRSDEVF